MDIKVIDFSVIMRSSNHTTDNLDLGSNVITVRDSSNPSMLYLYIFAREICASGNNIQDTLR